MNTLQARSVVTMALLGAALLCAALAGCTRPSYPASRVAASVQELMKKEYGMDSTAKIVGDTLYLQLQLKELTTTDAKQLGGVLKKIQGAVLTITRVGLSSDARIKFMVVTANDPAWSIGLRIVQYLQDVKDYFYQRISRGDYEERLIFELEVGDDAQLLFSTPDHQYLQVRADTEGYTAQAIDRQMTMDEFVGRLIVSQFNMMNRNNPFLAVILNNAKLRYAGFQGDELVVKAANVVGTTIKPLTEKLLLAETKKALKKYTACHIRQIRVVGENSQTILISVTP